MAAGPMCHNKQPNEFIKYRQSYAIRVDTFTILIWIRGKDSYESICIACDGIDTAGLDEICCFIGNILKYNANTAHEHLPVRAADIRLLQCCSPPLWAAGRCDAGTQPGPFYQADSPEPEPAGGTKAVNRTATTSGSRALCASIMRLLSNSTATAYYCLHIPYWIHLGSLTSTCSFPIFDLIPTTWS